MVVTDADYQRAVKIARRACAAQRPFLTREDWEDVCQEAAVTLWKSGSVTRAWWVSFDTARKAQTAVHASLAGDRRGTDDVERDVLGRLAADDLLARLPYAQRQAIEEIDMRDRPWAETCRTLGVPDCTVARRRAAGLERLRGLVST